VIIHKYIERKISTDYFFIEGKLSIDSDYFIKSINKAIKKDGNENYKTHVKGQMTSWQHFVENKKFNEVLGKLIKEVDENLNLPRYRLVDAWGYCLKKDEKTNFHNHTPSLWSAALYLNKHSQKLDFPQINQSVKPEKGKFVLFSSILNHGCEESKSNSVKYGISFNMGELTIADINEAK
jgi:hypothetical protein